VSASLRGNRAGKEKKEAFVQPTFVLFHFLSLRERKRGGGGNGKLKKKRVKTAQRRGKKKGGLSFLFHLLNICTSMSNESRGTGKKGEADLVMVQMNGAGGEGGKTSPVPL